jgi:hypothetical protein
LTRTVLLCHNQLDQQSLAANATHIRRDQMARQHDDLPESDDLNRDDDRLPTIALIHVPHPTIPNLYQCCFEYVEPWQWSPETETVETGRWFFGAGKDQSIVTRPNRRMPRK